MVKTITGVVAWLKGWFFDKDEITSKEQALQSQINNKANQSDLNTTNSNINALESRVNNLEGIEFIKFVSTLPTASAETMNSLYLVPKSSGKTNDNYNIWVTAKNGSTYTWDKVDDFDLQTLSINWNSVTNKPSSFIPASHASSNTTYGVGTASNYGHNKIIDDLSKSSLVNGESLSAHQGYVLKNLIDALSEDVSSLQNFTVDLTASGISYNPNINDWGDASQVVTNVANALTNLQRTKLGWNEAVTSIELVPKSENSTGAIRLYYGDES